MRADYPNWLIERKYSEGTQTSQIHRVKKVEESYGSLDGHFANNTYDEVIASLQYSTSDERANKANPSKIKFDGNIRSNLQSYKSAAELYRKFLTDNGSAVPVADVRELSEAIAVSPNLEEVTKQRLSLERDMQAALRRSITSLDPALKIVDDGIERKVDSGFIDITCEDADGIVIVELKAGTTDARVIGQILGYMSDVHEEEGGKPVRGIIVAHDFDKRTKAAARVVPTLKLMKYAIEFKFTTED